MIQAFHQLIRLIYINIVLARHGLDQLIVSLHLFAPFRFIVYFNPWYWRKRPDFNRGVALRRSLEELGPIFVKLGQALSTRPDILPADIAIELCKLQDKVPAFTSKQALHTIEKAFGLSAYELFAEFDPIPLACASMAQVHAATLKTGEKVVVKILRPNMRPIIEQDLSIMRTLARLVDTYWPEARRFKPQEMIREFEHNLRDEMDLQREAANATQLRRNFKQSALLYVPEIFWDYTRENVLVMERIYGIPIGDRAKLEAHHINIKKLAERGVEIFFTQVFRDCFFHADMHPGNIFVSTEHPDEPQYICVDFGIIGTLSNNDKRYIAENLYAFFSRDYRRVAELHVESGWIPVHTRIEEFESAIRTVCEPIFDKPLKDISFAQVVLRLLQVARRFEMDIQPQLMLLQKTLLAIEGLGRQLYPELDLWQTAKPFLKRWLNEQMGPRAVVKRLKENLPFITEQLPYMPRLMFEVLTLQKMQLSQHTHSHLPQTTPKPKSTWYGLGLGVLLSVGVLDLLYLSNFLNFDNFVLKTSIIAVMSGLVMWCSYPKRRP